MGAVRSRAAVSIWEVRGSSGAVLGAAVGLSVGWGVPMSSGGGEPATEERGVVSPFSPLVVRWEGRPRGRGLEGVGAGRGVPRGAAGLVGAATTAEGMFWRA